MVSNLRNTVLFHFIFVMILISIVVASNESEATRILKLIRGSEGKYNGEDMLQWYEGKPINVNVSMYIKSLSNFNAVEMTFDIDFFLKLSWYDKRLVHNNSKSITLTTLSDMDNIWIPDLYFANARSALFLNVIKPNRHIDIGQSDLSLNTIVRVVPLPAKPYLFTRSITPSKQSIDDANTIDHLVAKWRRSSAIELDDDIDLPEMELVGMNASYCKAQWTRYNDDETSSTKGEFSCLEVELRKNPRPGHYLTLTYVPSGIVVIISWLSFWIDPQAAPARITLGFTTFLTLSTTTVTATKALPPVSYITALTIWLATCTFFVFATLIEFAIVYNISVRANKLMTHKKTQQLLESDDETGQQQLNGSKFVKHFNGIQLNNAALRIDTVRRLLFPLAFLIFVIVYSVTYSQ